MGIMRLTGAKKDKEDSKPDLAAQREIAEALVSIGRQIAAFPDKKPPSNKQLQDLYYSGSILTTCSVRMAKELRTVDSRTFRTEQARLCNIVVSIQEMVQDGTVTTKTIKSYKEIVEKFVEDMYELFLSSWSIDLRDKSLLKKATKAFPKKAPDPLPKKKAVRVASLADLATLVVTKEKSAAIQKYVEAEDAPPVKKKSGTTLDFTDQDSLILSKYKSYEKQFKYEDDEDLGMSIMATIPLIAITRPSYLNPDTLDAAGIVIETVSGYAVFPQQCVVGIQVSPTDAIKSAASDEVLRYIITTLYSQRNKKYELIGKPLFLNNMLCFWMMEVATLKKIQRTYPKFMVSTWTTCFHIT